REGRIWSSLSHPHVTPFYGWALEVSDYDVRACFVSQFCSRRDLPQYLRTEPGASKSRLIHEIATGLMYLHEKGVVHGDIKPTNVLVTYEGSAMLCDFGLSMALEDTSTHPQGSSRNTTPEFSAPELILFDSRDPPPRSKSTDVWAFGCTAMQVSYNPLPCYSTQD
ncbi:kinase-like domain-containing protein, partial [Cantharellus anzutake]|uniref:kinase-like domain-containing protein n=1 Tax=Cantharellus anzutake TaxID=1750568 RepID=UPI001902FE83